MEIDNNKLNYLLNFKFIFFFLRLFFNQSYIYVKKKILKLN